MLKIFFSFLMMLTLTSCVSQLLNPPVNYQSQVMPGISQADTLAMFGFPEQLIKLDHNKSVLQYPGAGILFLDNKQSHIFALSKSEVLQNLVENKDARLNPAENIPQNLAHSIIFTKNPKNEVSPYQAFAFLGDEENFIKGIELKFELDTYNTSTNTLCLAISSGFVKATQQALEAGAFKEANLKDTKTGRDYITASQCTKYLSDTVKLAAIDKLLNPPPVVVSQEESAQQLEVEKKQQETKKNELLDSIVEWLKPVEKTKAEKVPQPSEKK